MNSIDSKLIISNKKIIRYKNGEAETFTDPVICEEWFNLFLNEKLIYQTPVLNKEIDYLIYGLLFVKGHMKSIKNLEIKQNGRSWYITSSETFSGHSIRQMVEQVFDSIENEKSPDIGDIVNKFKADTILDLMRDFQKLPSAYHETGGVHMAAFATDKILYWADDISRRNSVDKVIGKVFLSDKEFHDGILVTSGRISSDIVIRMIKTGISLIASVSAPMDKAIVLADYYGITICGFTRGRRMNIYTHTDRVI